MSDRDEIENLLGRYCRGVSDLDTDLWGSTWAADARWVFTGGDDIVGRDAIVAKFSEIRSLYPLCVQQVTASVIEIDGDTGTGWVQVCEMQWRSDGATAELIGDYHDEYVRTDDGWQFASREFVMRVSGKSQRAARLHG